MRYLFSVAQSSTLLYRRIVFGRPRTHVGALSRRKLRRLQICDTAEYNSALRRREPRLNRYPIGWGQGARTTGAGSAWIVRLIFFADQNTKSNRALVTKIRFQVFA